MNALLSGDTVTSAVPLGQPEPFAATTAMVISPVGGGSDGPPGTGAPSVAASSAPAVIVVSIFCLRIRSWEMRRESRRWKTYVSPVGRRSG
ncbi:hypothetical protein Acsp01_01640 [Actinoplanes sp. NBRC 101535]|nr:hypothetical protein Acsp01_01640 [Actinoplanes sp. NBRC 101535]